MRARNLFKCSFFQRSLAASRRALFKNLDASGFTLIELMVTITLFGIIALMGADAMIRLVNNKKTIETKYGTFSAFLAVKQAARSLTALSNSKPGNTALSDCLSGKPCTVVTNPIDFKLAAINGTPIIPNYVAGTNAAPVFYDTNGAVCQAIGGFCIMKALTSFLPGCASPTVTGSGSSAVSTCTKGAEYIQVNASLEKMQDPPGAQFAMAPQTAKFIVNVKDAGATTAPSTGPSGTLTITSISVQNRKTYGGPSESYNADDIKNSGTTPLIFNVPTGSNYTIEDSYWFFGSGGGGYYNPYGSTQGESHFFNRLLGDPAYAYSAVTTGATAFGAPSSAGYSYTNPYTYTSSSSGPSSGGTYPYTDVSKVCWPIASSSPVGTTYPRPTGSGPDATITSGGGSETNLLMTIDVKDLNAVTKVQVMRQDFNPNCNFNRKSLLSFSSPGARDAESLQYCGTGYLSDFKLMASLQITDAMLGSVTTTFQCELPRRQSGRQVYTLVALSADSTTNGTQSPANIEIMRDSDAQLFLPLAPPPSSSPPDKTKLQVTMACDDAFTYLRGPSPNSGPTSLMITDDFGLDISAGVTIDVSVPFKRTVIAYDVESHNRTYNRFGYNGASYSSGYGQVFTLKSGDLPTAPGSHVITITVKNNLLITKTFIFTLTIPAPATTEMARIGTDSRTWDKADASIASIRGIDPLIIVYESRLNCGNTVNNFKATLISYNAGGTITNSRLNRPYPLTDSSPTCTKMFPPSQPMAWTLMGDTVITDSNEDTTVPWDYTGKGLDSDYYHCTHKFDCNSWSGEPGVCSPILTPRVKPDDLIQVDGKVKSNGGPTFIDTSYFKISKALLASLLTDDVYWLTDPSVKQKATQQVRVKLQLGAAVPSTDLIAPKFQVKEAISGKSVIDLTVPLGQSYVEGWLNLPVTAVGGSPNVAPFPSSGSKLTYRFDLSYPNEGDNLYTVTTNQTTLENDRRRNLFKITYDSTLPGTCSSGVLRLIQENLEKLPYDPDQWARNMNAGQDNFETYSTKLDIDNASISAALKVNDASKITELFLISIYKPLTSYTDSCSRLNSDILVKQCTDGMGNSGTVDSLKGGMTQSLILNPGTAYSFYGATLFQYFYTAFPSVTGYIAKDTIRSPLPSKIDFTSTINTNAGKNPIQLQSWYNIGNVAIDHVMIKACVSP